MDKNEIIGQTLIAYTEKMRDLLAENLLKSPEKAAKAMTEARRIVSLINSFGWYVDWSVEINPDTPDKVIVKANLWQPRENLSPDLQVIYDRWLENVKKRGDSEY